MMSAMRLVSSLFSLLLLSGCIHIHTTRHEYTASSPPARLGGSAFRAEFLPQNEESGLALSAMVIGGATVSEVGPFLLRLHAFGTPGDQRWFEIKSLRLSGPDNFNAPMEPRGFVGRATFEPTQTPGQTRASLLLGPHLRLDEKKLPTLVLDAQVAIARRSGVSTGHLHIPLKLTKTSRGKTTYLLTEIWHDIHQRNSMDNLPQRFPPPPESP